MITQVKLAHISDLHLTQVQGLPPSTWNLKRCLGYLNWIRQRHAVHSRAIADKILQDIWTQDVDHLAITGDITNLGLRDEHAEARRWLDDQGSTKRISVVPGNHDIYSDLREQRSCLEAWKEFMLSDQESASFTTHVSSAFPFVRRLGSLVLIGLNSAVPTRPFRADGCLGEAQIAALKTLLIRAKKENLIRVLLIHHPPISGLTAPRRALKDAPQLEEILKEHGAEIILHGHNHKASVKWLEIRTGQHIPIIGVASGSTAFKRGLETLASYHLFHFRFMETGPEISFRLRGLKTREGDVVELQRTQLWPRGDFLKS